MLRFKLLVECFNDHIKDLIIVSKDISNYYAKEYTYADYYDGQLTKIGWIHRTTKKKNVAAAAGLDNGLSVELAGVDDLEM